LGSILIINQILFELSNEERLRVFKALFNEKKKHSDLEQELSLPGSEISRHLKRLNESHLIRKSLNHQYSITNLGKIFYQLLDIFEVSIKLREFFNTHSITMIPLDLILQLGSIKTIELGTNTIQNLELYSDMIKNAESVIYITMHQVQNSIIPVFEKKIQNKSMDIRVLVDKTVLISSQNSGLETLNRQDPEDFFKKVDLLKPVKIYDNTLDFSLLITDKGAMLFLDKDGEIDYNQCLLDNNKSFIEWTTELFEYSWEKGNNLQ